MKFKLLSIGQKFEYKGEIYIKSSPLIAVSIESNQNKIIPLSASLVLLEHTGTNKQDLKTETIDSQEILTAFNLFYEHCITVLDKQNILIPEIKNEMDQAREKFIKHIVRT